MKVSRIFFFVILVLLLGFGVWYGVFRGGELIIDRPQTGENTIFFGDSLVEGMGASVGNDLPSQVAEKTGMSILNAGKSGDTTGSALSRLSEDVLVRDPKIVILLLGGNDALRSIPSERTFSNLEDMIQQIHGQDAAVLLLGMPNIPFGGNYESKYDELAEKERISFIPNILKGVIGNPDLMADRIHPNDRGYEKMAERIAPLLLQMLGN